jgi:hypothetical protein
MFLSDLDASFRPGDPNWLLKPLFSYAGGGIIFGPTDADIAAIPMDQRPLYVIQERVNFTPVIDTPFGATQAEIRLMFVDQAGARLCICPAARAHGPRQDDGRGSQQGTSLGRRRSGPDRLALLQ